MVQVSHGLAIQKKKPGRTISRIDIGFLRGPSHKLLLSIGIVENGFWKKMRGSVSSSQATSSNPGIHSLHHKMGEGAHATSP